jgi:hypothetical protein
VADAHTTSSAAPPPPPSERAMSKLAGFRWDEVTPSPTPPPEAAANPPLGPLAAFTGNWQGVGLNTIFRPQNEKTPTPLPTPKPEEDNVLELNLTSELLSFSKELGRVPNRGKVQGDIFLNGVPYLQTIEDVTADPHTSIHFEPGIWLAVPSTENPQEPETLVRMASIPHGTTICLQGVVTPPADGAPNIPAVDITPFSTATPTGKIPFASQKAAEADTARIPQDLTPFISAGTITQEILDDPNTVLRNATGGFNILKTTTISVASNPSSPLLGGGTDNVAFLLGDEAALTNPNGPGQNAQASQASATFWIQEVQFEVELPAYGSGSDPIQLVPQGLAPGQLAPTFELSNPGQAGSSRSIELVGTIIQYSQLVALNFNTLTWPHVTVSTLIPASPIPIPALAL